jgi:hypothetical protein
MARVRYHEQNAHPAPRAGLKAARTMVRGFEVMQDYHKKAAEFAKKRLISMTIHLLHQSHVHSTGGLQARPGGWGEVLLVSLPFAGSGVL